MRGFSLLELLLALLITLAISAIAFQLFRQNERTFQLQTDALQVQQNARAVIFQINDDIRRTGQGVPLYASAYDSTASDVIAPVLDGSDTTHLRIREGYSNAQADVVTMPADYVLNVPQTASVSDAAAFYNVLGTTTPSGVFLYLWGSGAHSCWSWIRASLVTIAPAANTVTIIPRQIGEGCRLANDTVRLTAASMVTLEQAASVYLNGSSIWRTTAADMTDPVQPSWSAASEIGRDFADLTFTYYDVNDNVIQPNSLPARLAVVRIDTAIRTQTGLAFTIRTYPANLRVR